MGKGKPLGLSEQGRENTVATGSAESDKTGQNRKFEA